MLILDGPPLRLACDRCHKRKQRCTRTGINDNKPCERCREAGSQCVYSPPSRLGRPSNKSKREREQLSNNNEMTTGSYPSSATTSPTPPPPSHSFSLSASSVSVPTYMSMAAHGQSKTKTRRSHSTMAAASLRFKKPSSPPLVSSQFSDRALSPSSYSFSSPPLHTMDAVGGNTSFQNLQIPRSQPQHYHEHAVSGSVIPSPEHHPNSLLIAPEQQSWGAMPQDQSNNMIFGSPTYDNPAILLQQQSQRQQPQPLYTLDAWPNLMATHNPLQLQASQEVPRMVGPGGNACPRWNQPVADPQVTMNLGIPVTMAMDGNQPMYYYW